MPSLRLKQGIQLGSFRQAALSVGSAPYLGPGLARWHFLILTTFFALSCHLLGIRDQALGMPDRYADDHQKAFCASPRLG